MNFAGADRLSAALGLGFLNSNMGVMMGGGVSVRMGEEVATYGTLPPECYTPTPEKPWRGIWCGDYSGHGCEFLLINQPDKGTESPLPRGMDWMRDWLATGRRGSVSSQDSSTSAQEDVIMDVLEDEDGEDGDDDFAAAAVDWDPRPGSVGSFKKSSSAEAQDDASNDAYTGRLEAIKLTGDPNVPRGEYTFIAPDLSDAGLVRVASDELFQGARMVRAAGHSAWRGFRNGMSCASFVPLFPLIMVNSQPTTAVSKIFHTLYGLADHCYRRVHPIATHPHLS